MERGGDLLSKLPGQVERHSPEICVLEQVVEVVGEELKDEAEVVAPHEVVAQLDHVVLVLVIRPVHHFYPRWACLQLTITLLS